ncbi:mannan endo-1,4-beta-mannosidase A [Acrasis kona]|uniref:Mannan endo-1,4-beta-mannosidase A n=1 Tax=Acrasis kona TaxID=1008807 RepID=A0AAW2ZA53_9EUKA
MIDILSVTSYHSSEYQELSPLALKKHHTSPSFDRSTTPEDSIFEEGPSQFVSNDISLPESLCIWSNQKSLKDIDRVIVYACLCELVLRERISTFAIEEGIPIFSLYVINKKPTGQDSLDEVLSTIIKLQKENRTISEVMQEVEYRCIKKVSNFINYSLMREGIMSVKTSFLGFQKYTITDDALKEDIKSYIRSSIVSLSTVNDIEPAKFAFLGLLQSQCNILEKETGEFRTKIQRLLSNMVDNYELYQKNVVVGSILERLHHVLCEFNK